MKFLITIMMTILLMTSLSFSLFASPSDHSITLMFYLNNQTGDHIDNYTQGQFAQLLHASSKIQNDKINILAVHKFTESENDILVFLKIENGNFTVIKRIDSGIFSDSTILQDFLTLGYSYQSDRNILFMSNHGMADEGLMITEFKQPNGKKVVSSMKNKEAASAINQASLKAGRALDLIVFDMCLMANIEAFTEYSSSKAIRYVVASENPVTVTGGGGLPLKKIMQSLFIENKQNEMTTTDIGHFIVNTTKGNNTINIGLYDLEILRSSEILSNFKKLVTLLENAIEKDDQFLSKINDGFFDFDPEKGSPLLDGPGLTDLLALLDIFEKAANTQDKKMIKPLTNLIKKDLDKLIMTFESDQTAVQTRGISIKTMFGGTTETAKISLHNFYKTHQFNQLTEFDRIITKLFTF